MKCKNFWRKYEESGLTPELENHLEECKNCKNEMKIEILLNKKVKTLPEFKAPEELWEKINIVVQSNIKHKIAKIPLKGKIRSIIKNLIPSRQIIPLKPAVIGISFILLLAVGLNYYFLRPLSPEEKIRLQAEAAAELEETENEYLAAIEKFSKLIESSEEYIDPELYQLYQEKLALLDEFILQCKDAINQNEYNINARKYLALAYKEKVETLQKMSENISYF